MNRDVEMPDLQLEVVDHSGLEGKNPEAPQEEGTHRSYGAGAKEFQDLEMEGAPS